MAPPCEGIGENTANVSGKGKHARFVSWGPFPGGVGRGYVEGGLMRSPATGGQKGENRGGNSYSIRGGGGKEDNHHTYKPQFAGGWRKGALGDGHRGKDKGGPGGPHRTPRARARAGWRDRLRFLTEGPDIIYQGGSPRRLFYQNDRSPTTKTQMSNKRK